MIDNTSSNWKRSLTGILIAELLAMVGFSFVFPFMPLFIEKLGNYTTSQAAFWAGLAEGASGLGMFVFSPIWGIVADRSGRKPMLLRAIFGASVAVGAVAIVPNVGLLILLRFIQGALTGTVGAASALAAAITPRKRLPFAMGLLMTMIYVGNSVGPLLGGFAADHLGFQATFIITGVLMLISGFVVLFTVKEKFEKPVNVPRTSFAGILRFAGSREMLPLLIIMFMLQAGPNMVNPIISLVMQELNPAGEAATAAGIAIGISAVAAALTATLAGRLSDRVPLKTILVYSTLGMVIAYIPPMFATSVGQLTVYIALRGLLIGALTTSAYAILSLAIAPEKQGIAFGLNSSAIALGNGIGPTIGGALGATIGLQPVFGVTAAIFLLTSFLVMRMLPAQPAAAQTHLQGD
jgi:MFS transporter, DHA1 family, multidrug resistance protein